MVLVSRVLDAVFPGACFLTRIVLAIRVFFFDAVVFCDRLVLQLPDSLSPANVVF